MRSLAGHRVDNQSVRDLEWESIRAFVSSCSEHLTGRVLDYGCGLQPYRDIIEAAGGEYVGYDDSAFPANVSGEDVGTFPRLGDWHDAILCTQVIQYLRDPRHHLTLVFKHLIRPGGHLILTYPTTWAEVEPEDLWRFTRSGMSLLLERAGFEVLRHEERAGLDLGGFHLPLGYGVVARA